jgi:hypothetical protein
MQVNLQRHGNYMATAKHWNGMSKNDQNTCLEYTLHVYTD